MEAAYGKDYLLWKKYAIPIMIKCEATRRELDMRPIRIQKYFRYARDYAYMVFERYQRRYGYLSPIKAANHVDKISDRWMWHNYKAHVHVPYNHNFKPHEVSGPFCPVYFDVGYLLPTGHPEYFYCDHCHSKLILKKGVVLNTENNKFHKSYDFDDGLPELWSIPFTKKWTDVPSIEICSNELCVQARNYIEGKHHLIEEARKINVPLKRPLTKWRNAEEKDKLVIAAAGLLDFEARYMQRKNKLTKNINHKENLS